MEGIPTLAVSAVLLAGFYAAMAYGLGLIYGVLRIVYLLFTGNDQAIRTRYAVSSVRIFGANYSVSRIVVFVIAVVALLVLHLFLTRTYWGKAIRAVAQNPDSCTLVGINVERIYVLTFGLGTALAGLAGVLASTLFA